MIPARWPDVRLWAITRAKTMTGSVKVSAERDEALKSQVVISVAPAQRETHVSRVFLVTAECWAPDKGAALALAGEVAYAWESAPKDCNPVVRFADGGSGPNEARDAAGNYFYDVTVPVVIYRLP